MLHLAVIGIGTGNPEHMTVQAIGALNRADVVLIPRKGAGKDDLAALRLAICDRFLTNPATRIVAFDLPRRDDEGDYLGGVDAWHGAIAAGYRDLLDAEAPDGGTVALLVWGDPSLYDSTLRILERLKGLIARPFAATVTPGITSLQALTASHGIPLNAIGGDVLVTTGRRVRAGLPDDARCIAVMLDGACAFRGLPGDAFGIYWGAYLGMAQEILIAGPLGAVSERIVATRERARAEHGWIMDVYLLLRR